MNASQFVAEICNTLKARAPADLESKLTNELTRCRLTPVRQQAIPTTVSSAAASAAVAVGVGPALALAQALPAASAMNREPVIETATNSVSEAAHSLIRTPSVEAATALMSIGYANAAATASVANSHIIVDDDDEKEDE